MGITRRSTRIWPGLSSCPESCHGLKAIFFSPSRATRRLPKSLREIILTGVDPAANPTSTNTKGKRKKVKGKRENQERVSYLPFCLLPFSFCLLHLCQ